VTTINDIAAFFNISADDLCEALCEAKDDVRVLLAAAEAPQDADDDYVMGSSKTWPRIEARLDEGTLVRWRKDRFGRQWYGPPPANIEAVLDDHDEADDAADDDFEDDDA
jgi:hypothetical protein